MVETRVLQRALGVTLLEVALRDESGAMVDGGYLVRGHDRSFDFTGVCLETATAHFRAAVAHARASQLQHPVGRPSPLNTEPVKLIAKLKGPDRRQTELRPSAHVRQESRTP